jgi:CubicO group peptidase (beta-lactamase class C family)
VTTLRKPLLRAPLFQLLALALSFSQSAAQEAVIARASPEAHGFSSENLAEAIDFLASDSIDIHSLLVARRGELLLGAFFYPFDEGMLHDVASVTKSVVALLTLMAVERGNIPSLDSPVSTLLPAAFARHATPAAREIRVRDLLDMRSGWDCGLAVGEIELEQMREASNWIAHAISMPVVSSPGAEFAYCSSNFHVLSGILSEATGMSAADFASEELFAPLGIGAFRWPSDPQGISHGWGDLALTSDAMLRIGVLLASGGRWEGRSIIGEEWVGAIAGDGTSSEYRLGWWRSSDSPWQFEANGRGGQRITVLPELEAVIVMTGGGFEPAIAGELLGRAFLGDGLQPVSREPLAAAIERARVGTSSASGPLPPDVNPIRGLFQLDPNPLGIDSLSLELGADHPTAAFWLSNGEIVRQDVGQEGRFVLSSNGGLMTAARGHWTGDLIYRLELNLLARIGRLSLDIRAVGEGLEIGVTDRNTGETFEMYGTRGSPSGGGPRS